MDQELFLRLPSTTALRYFVAAARLLSVTAAAQELHVSQAAVSKQIRQLEMQLGKPLFVRDKQRITLTALGEWYYQEAVSVLRHMQKMSVSMQDDHVEIRELHVGVLPTFAAQFLIPLLPDFYAAHPDVRLQLYSESGKVDFASRPYDLMISFNIESSPDVSVYNIINERLIVVASPLLLDTMVDAQRIAALPQLMFTPRPGMWHDWFADTQHHALPPQMGLMFETFQMLIQAAIAGLGVALIPEFLILRELAAGTLLRVHEHSIESASSYFMAVPNIKAQDRAVVAFRHWLKEAMDNGS
ncbi:LysR family transcriptional regulator [Cardiobacteriaceae bacterium TAE3-ERU3]|nr:LysR family transcriptional regulator [Cardiobacteriaceae bacterium TAE3-ERU3]